VKGLLLTVGLAFAMVFTSLGLMFMVMAAGDGRLLQLEGLMVWGSFCLMGLYLGARCFGGLRTRGQLVAGLGVSWLVLLVGIYALLAVRVAAWSAVIAVGLAGVVACLVRIRRLP
jgi:hypothetical protein